MSLLAVLSVVTAVLLWPGRSPSWTSTRGRGTAPRDAHASGPSVGVRAALRRPRGPREVTLADAASVAELLAMGLRSGGAPARAVEVILPEAPAAVRPLLESLRDELAEGGSGAAVWQRAGLDDPVLRPCSAAWRLSEETGVALAPALEQAARSSRAEESARQRLEAASAGARATMWLLTLLPVLGVLAGSALGVSPMQIVTASSASAVSVGVGIALTLVGWVIGQSILRRAMRPGVG